MSVKFILQIKEKSVTIKPVTVFRVESKEGLNQMTKTESGNYSPFMNSDLHIKLSDREDIKDIHINLEDNTFFFSNDDSIVSASDFKTLKDTFTMSDRIERKLQEKLRLNGYSLENLKKVTPSVIVSYLIKYTNIVGYTMSNEGSDIAGSIIRSGRKNNMECTEQAILNAYGIQTAKAA